MTGNYSAGASHLLFISMYKLSLETLSEERLRKSVNEETIDLAKSLFDKGAVSISEVKDFSAVCTVLDIRNYYVEFQVANKHIYLKCNCSHASRGLICEHEAAAWMGLRAHLQKKAPPAWRTQLIQLINKIPDHDNSNFGDGYLIFFSVQEDQTAIPGNWIIQPYFLPESAFPDDLNRGNDIDFNTRIKKYISKNDTHPLRVQKLLTPQNHSRCLNNSNGSANIANLILERSKLPPTNTEYPLHEYLSLLANSNILLFKGDEVNPLEHQLELVSTPGEFKLGIEKKASEILIKPILTAGEFSFDQANNSISIMCNSPLWIQADRYLISLPNDQSTGFLSFLDHLKSLSIKDNQEELFLNRYLLELSRKITIESELIKWKSIECDPIFRIYLDDNDGELQAQIRYAYGDFEVLYDPLYPTESTKQIPNTWTLAKVKRSPQQEKEAFDQISSTSFGMKRCPSSSRPGIFRLRARIHPVDFLLNTVPRLSDAGYEIIGEKELKTAKVNRNTPKISFDVSSGFDWFDVKTIVSFGDLQVELRDIRKAIKKKQRFIKLSDGTIGELPEEWFERYKHLFSLGKTKDDNLRFTHHQITLLDEILEKEEQKHFDSKYQTYRQKLENLRSFEKIEDKPLPKGFTGELRPYQKAGFNWLHFLREFRFGGCLADDMGLGKTIQTLAFLMSIYEESEHKKATSLLVVPRSLLINWQREIANFTPNLRVQEYFDTNRTKEIQTFDQTDLVITTYGVLLRDIQFLHSYQFYYAILDESQAIKNPNSQTARAAHLIDAKHKLVLTGTPIENSTSELWSQFSYLNPGLLGSQRYFRNTFISPIEKKGDEQVVEDLRRIIYPFILRRTKDQVAPELPPRSEKIIYCDMEPDQKEYYQRVRDYYRGLLLGMIDSDGFEKSQIKILEGLLRLRQISNHPRLVDGNYKGTSGKFGLLLDHLTTLKAEGHKALIFSQFVQMLKLVRSELEKQKLAYTYLDGSTQNRQLQVDTFQEQDKIPFFLISLKAGGLGLNLTAADYVIHIDPWWNPAVEMQASDRTHRIGQDKPVFVFKMITRNTVEEKILLLQERKRNLVDQIITTESSFFKSLSKEEIEVLFSS